MSEFWFCLPPSRCAWPQDKQTHSWPCFHTGLDLALWHPTHSTQRTHHTPHTNANALRSRWVSGSVSVRVCLIIQFESYSLCDHVLEATAQLEPSLVQFRAPSQQRSTLGVRVVNQSVSRQSAASLAKNLLTKLNFWHIIYLPWVGFFFRPLFFFMWPLMKFSPGRSVGAIAFFTTSNVCNLKLVAGQSCHSAIVKCGIWTSRFPVGRTGFATANDKKLTDSRFAITLALVPSLELRVRVGLASNLHHRRSEDRRWQAVKLPLNSCRSCWFLMLSWVTLRE